MSCTMHNIYVLLLLFVIYFLFLTSRHNILSVKQHILIYFFILFKQRKGTATIQHTWGKTHSMMFPLKCFLISYLFATFPKAWSFVVSAPTCADFRKTRTWKAPRRSFSSFNHYQQPYATPEDTYICDEIIENDRLNEPPDPLRNTKDDFFRQVRNTVPLPLQYFLRDSGLLRLIVDSLVFLGVPSLLHVYPTAWNDFQTLSGRSSNTCSDDAILFRNVKYGKYRQQRIEIMQTKRQIESSKWIVFVHGGAWGSGFPLLYRLVANSFLSEGFHVAIVGYRTYPDTIVNGQIDDIVQAIEFLREEDEEEASIIMDITLMGHSSGAHIGMLGILQNKIQGIRRFVGISGVYDIPQHYQFESKRGVERISPLAPVCGGILSQWKRNSPSRWHSFSTLEGNPVSLGATLPQTLLMHGEIDSTVPYTSSMNLFQSLKIAPQNAEDSSQLDFKILKGVEHSETILHLMFGGETREILLQWIQK